MLLTPGTRLGPYVIVAPAGAGAMGAMYRATDVNLGRAVTLELLPVAVAEYPESLARFEREIASLAALTHVNIAAIYGVERFETAHALVTELVEGTTLAERIARGPLPLDHTFSVARQVAEALATAHEREVVHGDLRPATINVGHDGTVKVLSFGVAPAIRVALAGVDRSVGSREPLTPASGARVPLSDLAYASFEQAVRLPVGKPADIWAFGCVLFEMLTGRRAFDGKDDDAILDAVKHGIVRWDALPAEVPAALADVLRSCLQRDRRMRMTASELTRNVSPRISPPRAGSLPQVFISYDAADRPWVDQLHKALDVRLRQILGLNVAIWRDPDLPAVDEAFRIRRDPKDGGSERPLASLVGLHEAAALVCLVSPAYVRNPRCLWELREYAAVRHGGRVRPVFKVALAPLAAGEMSVVLTGAPAYEFYATNAATGTTRVLDQIFGPDAERTFWIRLDDLAHDVARVLGSPSDPPPDQERTFSFTVTEPGRGDRPLRVFLCHASDDKPEVKALYRSLVAKGVDAWLDEEKLLPGQLWEIEIPRAVKRSDAVVVCLSRRSLTKKGYVQKEIRLALDAADEHPEGALFLIPAKLEECDVPDRLSNRHWVKLYEDLGPGTLLRALNARALQLTVESASPPR